MPINDKETLPVTGSPTKPSPPRPKNIVLPEKIEPIAFQLPIKPVVLILFYIHNHNVTVQPTIKLALKLAEYVDENLKVSFQTLDYLDNPNPLGELKTQGYNARKTLVSQTQQKINELEAQGQSVSDILLLTDFNLGYTGYDVDVCQPLINMFSEIRTSSGRKFTCLKPDEQPIAQTPDTSSPSEGSVSGKKSPSIPSPNPLSPSVATKNRMLKKLLSLKADAEQHTKPIEISLYVTGSGGSRDINDVIERDTQQFKADILEAARLNGVAISGEQLEKLVEGKKNNLVSAVIDRLSAFKQYSINGAEGSTIRHVLKGVDDSIQKKLQIPSPPVEDKKGLDPQIPMTPMTPATNKRTLKQAQTLAEKALPATPSPMENTWDKVKNSLKQENPSPDSSTIPLTATPRPPIDQENPSRIDKENLIPTPELPKAKTMDQQSTGTLFKAANVPEEEALKDIVNLQDVQKKPSQ